jgi:DNA adenine methylase
MYKPFLKWVGGKQQLLERINGFIPSKINTYFELFLGGGAVMLNVLKRMDKGELKINNIVCNDLNNELINVYNCIKHEVVELVRWLEYITYLFNLESIIVPEKRHKFNITVDITHVKTNEFTQIFESIQRNGKHYFYYGIRELYNLLINESDKELYKRTKLLRGALFIFLNKTCFRGLHRMGNGKFNVPYGNYPAPTIYSKEQIYLLNKLFVKYNVRFISTNYTNLIKYVKTHDFVYLDPPYYPTDRQSFTSYDKHAFGEKEHIDLINACNIINSKNGKFLHSNSDTPFNNSMYSHYSIQKVSCSRRINSKKPNSKIDELLIYN